MQTTIQPTIIPVVTQAQSNAPLTGEAATSTGEKFVKTFYYDYFDNRRDDLVSYYRDWSRMIWNGKDVTASKNTLPATQAIAAYLKEIPSSKHRIATIDAQPIYLSVNNVNATQVLVVVTGTVVYGGDFTTGRYFTQEFILVPERDPQTQKFTCYIASDSFRWLAIPKKQTGFERKPGYKGRKPFRGGSNPGRGGSHSAQQ